MQFAELLQLPILCEAALAGAGVALVMGGSRGETTPVFFGIPVHTSPAPVLMRGIITERGTMFNDFSLFAWMEENFLAQPRADIVGLMPDGAQPLLFLRDLDLDRPPEAFVRQNEKWLRVTGIVIQGSDRSDLAPVFCALRLALPNQQILVDELEREAKDNASFRAAIRARRKTHPPEVLRVCDAWRVLAQAAPLRLAPSADPQTILSFVETFTAL